MSKAFPYVIGFLMGLIVATSVARVQLAGSWEAEYKRGYEDALNRTTIKIEVDGRPRRIAAPWMLNAPEQIAPMDRPEVSRKGDCPQGYPCPFHEGRCACAVVHDNCSCKPIELKDGKWVEVKK